MLLQADLLAARAKLFFSGSSHISSSQSQNNTSSSTLIGRRPHPDLHPDLEGECQEIATKIKQVSDFFSGGIQNYHLYSFL